MRFSAAKPLTVERSTVLKSVSRQQQCLNLLSCACQLSPLLLHGQGVAAVLPPIPVPAVEFALVVEDDAPVLCFCAFCAGRAACIWDKATCTCKQYFGENVAEIFYRNTFLQVMLSPKHS